MNLPATIRTEQELDELLSRPSAALVKVIGQLDSPLLVLGASGKMGPSLCWLARRAGEVAGQDLRVIAVSRFSDARTRSWLEAHGIEAVGCDLLDRQAVSKLPESRNLVYLVGLKFGTQQAPWLSWAVNTLVPSHVAERYRAARVVALSTGNIYPLVRVERGASELIAPAPIGEYGGTALARERIFEYYSRTQQTRTVLLRLNYAVEMRYGVLVDIAKKVWAGEPIELATGHLNCIWQGDANDLILRSFELATSPAAVFNLTGPAVLSVRELALRFGELMRRTPKLTGVESSTALLSDPAALCARLGAPAMPLDVLLRWTAEWVMQGGASLGKPTHFEVRTGQF